jgi:hypothetical protein
LLPPVNLPLLDYLIPKAVAKVLNWEKIEEYKNVETRSQSGLQELARCWIIYNRFFIGYWI